MQHIENLLKPITDRFGDLGKNMGGIEGGTDGKIMNLENLNVFVNRLSTYLS